MPDRKIHLIDQENGLSWLIADTTELSREAVARHQCGRSVAITLSKTLTGALLLGASLKDGEKQSLQLNTNGKLRLVMAEAWADGKVRGYPSVGQIPEIDDTFANHTTCLGTELQVGVVRSKDGDVHYTGSIHVDAPNVPKAVNEYLNNSEQIFSAIELYCQFKDGSVVNASGVLLRLLPGGNEAKFAEYAELFKMSKVFEHMTDQADIAETLLKIAPNLDLTRATEAPCKFECSCSRERVVSMLLTLGRDELADMRETDGEANITCHFCGAVYHFEATDLDRFVADFDRPHFEMVPLTAEEEAELDAIEAKVKAEAKAKAKPKPKAKAKAKKAPKPRAKDGDD